MIYRDYFKRLFDIIVALILLIILMPVWLVVILLLAFSNNGTPFFIQGRPGKLGKMFNLIKFKSMNDKLDINGELLPDSIRLTKMGRFARNTSLDELPQLINVLKGDMSLIGPRPLMEAYLPLYNNFQRRRHDVLPGITGWAQVNGRNAISWGKKFECDVWYVDNQSFFTDIRILWLTVLKVFQSEGINQIGVDNAVPFSGNREQV